MKGTSRISFLALCLAAFLCGCASDHRRRVRAREVVVTQPPPPAQSEVIPPAPGPNYVWVPGYWAWDGKHNYVWQSGHYEARPTERARYEPGHWERTRQGWVWEPGRWR
jgi:hypothetical protein